MSEKAANISTNKHNVPNLPEGITSNIDIYRLQEVHDAARAEWIRKNPSRVKRIGKAMLYGAAVTLSQLSMVEKPLHNSLPKGQGDMLYEAVRGVVSAATFVAAPIAEAAAEHVERVQTAKINRHHRAVDDYHKKNPEVMPAIIEHQRREAITQRRGHVANSQEIMALNMRSHNLNSLAARAPKESESNPNAAEERKALAQNMMERALPITGKNEWQLVGNAVSHRHFQEAYHDQNTQPKQFAEAEDTYSAGVASFMLEAGFLSRREQDPDPTQRGKAWFAEDVTESKGYNEQGNRVALTRIKLDAENDMHKMFISESMEPGQDYYLELENLVDASSTPQNPYLNLRVVPAQAELYDQVA